MGIYLNPQNTLFQNMKNSEIYVDHSLMIENINKIINTENNKLCVSRPRRFGKSTDANMLVAYYSKGCDSSNIFKDLKISQTELYQKHLNQHNVIHINMQDFLSKTHDVDKMIILLTKLIFRDIKKIYQDIEYFDIDDLIQVLEDVYVEVNERFIFVIDEWDCIFREYQGIKEPKRSIWIF
ncbi:MAG: AAA family ATPase [Thomasclavelia sp.]